ncbi:BnaC08g04680D [Brassica napus]|uniref:BnaC08g04680D protein n=1 Tax=Brassica napus TaxID=3708 RepID=A0A078IEN2_BRANA|nr:BnaC08g04680D [Brassica napus]
MTALDYIKNQPRLQDKHLTQTTNTFSALASFLPYHMQKQLVQILAKPLRNKQLLLKSPTTIQNPITTSIQPIFQNQ